MPCWVGPPAAGISITVPSGASETYGTPPIEVTPSGSWNIAGSNDASVRNSGGGASIDGTSLSMIWGDASVVGIASSSPQAASGTATSRVEIKVFMAGDDTREPLGHNLDDRAATPN